MTTGSVDLRFLSEDVRKQYAISKDILDRVEELRRLVEVASPEMRPQLDATIRKLVASAEGLAANATSTSSQVSSTIGFGFALGLSRTKRASYPKSTRR
jgi:hypothetical protein